MPSAIICSFSAGLDDLSRQQQRCHITVLRVLHRVGKFSAFEASENLAIATTVTALFHGGSFIDAEGKSTEHGPLVVDAGGAYPWTKIKLTPEGERLLKESEQ